MSSTWSHELSLAALQELLDLFEWQVVYIVLLYLYVDVPEHLVALFLYQEAHEHKRLRIRLGY